ncbi:MAG: hypothetical protein KBH73_10975 [Syntrophobacterales bacterium]|nr:hypothetical protein [Syntrophobacterales bacterium]HNQ01134.1 hypothetical protein [Syntrophales bacterium]HNS54055.1 hypothetical protein [Syntrophales bacterium]
MNGKKASTVNFRFWFDRQIRNARKPRALPASTENRFYYEKLLGKSKAEGRS